MSSVNKWKILTIWFSLVGILLFYYLNNTLLIIPYIIFSFFLLKYKNFKISPMAYFILPWGYMFVMYFSDFITYSQGKENDIALVYMTGGCLLIIFGYLIGKRAKVNIPNYMRFNAGNSKAIRQVINILALFGCIGSILFIVELVFVTGIDLSALSITREEFTTRNITVLTQIGNIISWGSIAVIPGIILINDSKKYEKVFWIISVILYSMYSVLSAGRQVVFQILIIFISSYMIKTVIVGKAKRESKKEIRWNYKELILISLVVLIVIGYCIWVASERNNGAISSSKTEVLAYYFGCSFNQQVDKILNMLPKVLNEGISEAIVYFTHEINGFKVFWSIDDSVGPFFGLYSAPFIDRRIASLGLTSLSVDEKMDYVRTYMRSRGAMPVGWKTFFSFIILDFGRLGSLLFCFLYGIYVGCVYKIFLKKRSFFSVMWLVRVNIGLFYTIMFPATCETGLLLWGFFCVVMSIIEDKYISYRLIMKG